MNFRPVLLLALILTACCPIAAEPIAVKEWSRDEQRQILAEERKLSDDSILIGVLEDYAKLRREVR
jgi:hypothetical protein